MQPPLSGKDRVTAVKKILSLLRVEISDGVDDALFAHSFLLKGGDFLSAVRELKSRGDFSIDGVVSALRPYSEKSVADVHLRVAKKAQPTGSGGGVEEAGAVVAAPPVVASNPFDKIGGNKEAKIALEDALALSKSKRIRLARMGIGAPIGVLLYGPPGTGKTLLARATAEAIRNSNEDSSDDDDDDNSSAKGDFGDKEGHSGGGRDRRGGSFVMLKASEVVRGEVGSSEKIVVEAFETVRQNGGGGNFHRRVSSSIH